MKTVEVYGTTLDVLGRADRGIGHPSDPSERGIAEPCRECILAVRRDTGEIVLLWAVGGKLHWVVSRADPSWKRHRSELMALP